MPLCNGADGSNITPLRKQADFQLVRVDEKTYEILHRRKSQMNVEQSMCATLRPECQAESIGLSMRQRSELQARIDQGSTGRPPTR